MLTGIGQVESIYRHIGGTVANGTYYLDKATYPYRIDSLWRDLKGTGTSLVLAIQINGTNVTSLSSLSTTSTEAEVAATGANAVAIGDEVTAVVTSATGSPTDLVFRLKVTRT